MDDDVVIDRIVSLSQWYGNLLVEKYKLGSLLMQSQMRQLKRPKRLHLPPSMPSWNKLKRNQSSVCLTRQKRIGKNLKKRTKGLEEELDAYKKNSNHYLEKVSFLQRADCREFERERGMRLALPERRWQDTRKYL